ncbi:hypothetical protein BJ508DRAFT_373862 [Ascobolus immersus RN42]|uniref:Uncharacterized protein n=1 Tax=Ascobolus immersus RN42 TaxID=1160509 RepID=A0A3N4IH40_ASCIM|nr:hypothetical protein BJ508DRAFT_373862 [Ascobolus immersus RN42]
MSNSNATEAEVSRSRSCSPDPPVYIKPTQICRYKDCDLTLEEGYDLPKELPLVLTDVYILYGESEEHGPREVEITGSGPAVEDKSRPRLIIHFKEPYKKLRQDNAEEPPVTEQAQRDNIPSVWMITDKVVKGAVKISTWGSKRQEFWIKHYPGNSLSRKAEVTNARVVDFLTLALYDDENESKDGVLPNDPFHFCCCTKFIVEESKVGLEKSEDAAKSLALLFRTMSRKGWAMKNKDGSRISKFLKNSELEAAPGSS